MTNWRKHVQIFCGFIILLVILSCNGEKKYDILIKNSSIINVEDGSLQKLDLAILGDRIVAIEKNIPQRESHRVIDGTNKFIIPALWDMHVHFETWGYEPMAKLMIANGVLGARDMGGNSLERLDEMKAKLGKEMPNMRILRAGRMLDGQTPGWPFRITVTDSVSAIKAVMDKKKEGVDFIKVHQQLNLESYKAIAKTANEYNLMFAGHVPHRVGGEIASKLGQTSFEHLTGTPPCSDDDCSNIESLLKLYIQNQTYQALTLSIFYADVQTYNHQRIDEQMKAYINPWVEKEWKVQDSINRQFIGPYFDKMPEISLQRAKTSYQTARKMFSMNVPVVAATDAGFPGVIPGFDLHNELRLMVEEAGATNLQALQSATLTPVKMHNLKDLGKIDIGYFADLLILNGNPLEQIKATRDIEMVISNGEILDQNRIQQLKDQCKK